MLYRNFQQNLDPAPFILKLVDQLDDYFQKIFSITVKHIIRCSNCGKTNPYDSVKVFLIRHFETKWLNGPHDVAPDPWHETCSKCTKSMYRRTVFEILPDFLIVIPNTVIPINYSLMNHNMQTSIGYKNYKYELFSMVKYDQQSCKGFSIYFFKFFQIFIISLDSSVKIEDLDLNSIIKVNFNLVIINLKFFII